VFLALGLIPFVTFVGSYSTTVEDHTFRIMVWSVSLTLLLASASFSPYLSGWDIQREFPIFQQVSRSGVWNAQLDIFESSFNSVISVSILPAMIRAVSGLDGQTVFKFTFPLIFSTVPVVLYNIYRRVVSSKAAFLSVYLFMSYFAFYNEVNQIAKQMIAELLFVLLIWISLSAIRPKRSGATFAVLLTAGLTLSHYTLTYMYAGIITFSLIISRITRRVVAASTLMMIILCVVMTLVWYSFVAGGSAVMALTNFLSILVRSIVRDFLNPAARPYEALQAIGLTAWTPGFLHDLYRITNYIVQFCLLLGFIAFARKKNKTVVERKVLPLMTVGLILIGSAVILPNFGGIPLPRIYHISLLLASPCFVIGAELLESLWRKTYAMLARGLSIPQLPFSSRGKMIIAATILLSYFLFTSGWVWAVSLDAPVSVVLDGRRMANYSDDTKVAYYSEVDLPTDVSGALWLASYGENDHVCSDYISYGHVLIAYGGLNSTSFHSCSPSDLRKSYTFLSELNLLHGIEVNLSESVFGGTSYYKFSADLFTNGSNRLYSNGGTAIFTG